MGDTGEIARAVWQFIKVLIATPSSSRGVSFWYGDTDVPPMTVDGLLDTASLGPSAPTAQPLSVAERVHQQVAALQQLDPDFNDLAFLSQATAQYGSTLAAESAMNPDAFEGIATPSFIDWFRQRVAGWNSAGLRCVIQDVKLDGSMIIKVSVDGTAHAIVVRFSGSAVRYTQDVASGAAVDGAMTSQTFTEFATFVRPAGTTTPKTAASGGATHCPSCGAPTTSGAAACPYCGTQLTGTGATWLLDRISASAYT